MLAYLIEVNFYILISKDSEILHPSGRLGGVITSKFIELSIRTRTTKHVTNQQR